MRITTVFITTLIALLCAGVSADQAHAANTPIVATATFVKGKVDLISVREKRKLAVKTGRKFTAGDRIITSRNGVVEVTFDNNNVIRLDNSADLVIRSLHRNERGSTFSIFNMAFGRVKSLVSRLFSDESKFEYQTKAAIAGVAGTPPFVLDVTEDSTSVDLLGRKGDKGSIYVSGFDKKKTKVTLLPGFRTIVQSNQPPMKPFRIDGARFNELNNLKTKSGSEETPPPSTPSPGANILINSIAGKISVPRTPRENISPGLEELENHYDQGSGLLPNDPRESRKPFPGLYRGKATVTLK